MAKARERLPELVAAPRLDPAERRIVRALALLKKLEPAEPPESLRATVGSIARLRAAQADGQRPAEED